MSKAIVCQKKDVGRFFAINEVDPQKLSHGQVLIKNTVIGLNDDDFLCDNGVIPGYAAAGEIEEVGVGVKGFYKGDSIVYMSCNAGSFSEYTVVDVDSIVALPDEIYQKSAAAVYYPGLVAHTLLKRVYVVRPKTIVLIHDVTSSVGYILSQLASEAGALVVGSIDDDIKKDFALKNGCHKVVNYTSENWDKEVMDITKNFGVNIVYDNLGEVTFQKSLNSLTKMGIMSCYGDVYKGMKSIDIKDIASKSLYITFPSVFDYKKNRMELILSANDIFDLISSNKLKINIDSEYNMDQVEEAHKKISTHDYIGSLIMNI
ncbi:MAG: NADPH2:quinone reductase [Candidatus Midichloriaceae bacterium]|jgi:NADPH2:quinone reductase